MWHPNFSESRKDTSGLLVHFRKHVFVEDEPPKSLRIRITADTRYKLYINSQQVAFGPVKGDSSLWFYDEVDIAAYLRHGKNAVAVCVLRFFFATQFATSYPRLPSGGVWISVPETEKSLASQLESSTSWEAAVDPFITFRVDEPEDHFLHHYEKSHVNENGSLTWVPAKLLELKCSTGNAPPWHLSPRQIPEFRTELADLSGVRNVQSTLSSKTWQNHLVVESKPKQGLILPAGTFHSMELETSFHCTAFLRVRFKRPETAGGTLTVTYSESHEEEPKSTPWVRNKKDRCDYSKKLIGPKDIFKFQGKPSNQRLGYYKDEDIHEIFMPFHFRTFRFLKIEIETGLSDLVFDRLDIETVTYP